MSLKVVNATQEAEQARRVLTALITCTEVLARISPRWKKPGLFASKWENTVGSWCISHFEQYGHAPGKAVQAHFEKWCSKNREPEAVRSMEQFLSHLSDQYESDDWIQSDENWAHVVDLACEHFNLVAATTLFDDGSRELETGRLDDALTRIESFQKVQLGENADVDLLTDDEEIDSTFAESSSRGLFTYPGALGEFFLHVLERECFVAFVGAEKSGKSFWLADAACRAVLRGRRVAVFECGDMSKTQVKRRLLTRLARHPVRSPKDTWPYTVNVPHYITPPEREGDFAAVDVSEKVFDSPLDATRARKACRKVMKGRGKKSLLRLQCHPNSTISAPEISAQCKNWARQGWNPDLVVVDYADILAAPSGSGRMDVRDQINTNWKVLRALSSELHCLVMTATQCNREGYEREVMDRRNISEDKRKLSHVTALAFINSLTPERERGVCRLSWGGARDIEYSPRKVVHVGGCLAIGNPAIVSTF